MTECGECEFLPEQSPDNVSEEDPATLIVFVRWMPLDGPVEGATVEISGPLNAQVVVDEQGIATFCNIPPGGYAIEARLRNGSALVDLARSKIGRTDWAYNVARDPYPIGANKCNLFVFEMANGAGFVVPRRERWSWSQLKTVWYPPLAGHWATPEESIGDWKMIASPRPGDVISEAHDYLDATGHVGIVSYPEPSGESLEISAGACVTMTIVLQRQTVSAATTGSVVENDWGFRSDQHPKFRRYMP